MRYTRLLLTAIIAVLVDAGYGFLVYGVALAREVQMNNGVYRQIDAVNGNLPWLAAGLLLTMIAATFLYDRFAGPGAGLVTGLMFGVAVGLFAVGYVAIGNFVVMKLGRRLTLYMAAAQFGEWTLIGAVMGLIHRPGAGSRRA